VLLADEKRAATAGTRKGTTSRPGSGDAGASGVRLFIVDDCRHTLRILSRLLRGMGYEVTTADGFSSALAAAGGRTFDLLISDIELKDGSGIDLLRALSATEPVRAIALSGHLSREDIRRSRDAGFIEHVAKPVQFQKLHEIIARVTGTSAT